MLLSKKLGFVSNLKNIPQRVQHQMHHSSTLCPSCSCTPDKQHTISAILLSSQTVDVYLYR
jgi:hypothetical protein